MSLCLHIHVPVYSDVQLDENKHRGLNCYNRRTSLYLRKELFAVALLRPRTRRREWRYSSHKPLPRHVSSGASFREKRTNDLERRWARPAAMPLSTTHHLSTLGLHESASGTGIRLYSTIDVCFSSTRRTDCFSPTRVLSKNIFF